MPFFLTVLYPQGDFNEDYYLKTHMKLVEDAWKSHGLKDWKVVKIGPGADGQPAPYQIEAVLTFESAEGFGAAAAESGAKIFGDIPNFTSVTATVITGQQIGSSA